MATLYVSSVDGDDADNGSTWALAKATVAGALAVAGNGDIIYVDSAHSFSASSAAINWNAASGASVAIISVDRNGSTTTGHNGWLAGASESIGTNAFGFLIAGTGAQSLYIYGMVITGNSGSSSSNIVSVCLTAEATNKNVVFENCMLSAPGTNANSTFIFGQTVGSSHRTASITLKNCALVIRNSTAVGGFSARNAVIYISGLTVSYAGASKPASLVDFAGGCTPDLTIENSDLTGYEKSGGAYFDVAGLVGGSVIVRDCKLHATPSIVTGTWPSNSSEITFINTDSGNTKTVFEYRNRLGTIMESESIYADDGFQIDSTRVSWQIVTTADCNEATPFETPYAMIRTTSTSAMDVGFRIIHDSATDLHDRNIWPEISYVSDASFPKGSLSSGRNAQPFDGSAVDWPADGTTSWTGVGGFSNANPQTLDRTFTPAQACTLRGRLCIGVASKTLYVDPKMRVV